MALSLAGISLDFTLSSSTKKGLAASCTTIVMNKFMVFPAGVDRGSMIDDLAEKPADWCASGAHPDHQCYHLLETTLPVSVDDVCFVVNSSSP